MTVNEKDKPSIEEAFEHAGVKGMRWGVRKNNRDGSPKVARSKSLPKNGFKNKAEADEYLKTYLEVKKAGGLKVRTDPSFETKVDKFNRNLGRVVSTVSYGTMLILGVRFVANLLEETSGLPVSAIVPPDDGIIRGV